MAEEALELRPTVPGADVGSDGGGMEVHDTPAQQGVEVGLDRGAGIGLGTLLAARGQALHDLALPFGRGHAGERLIFEDSEH